MPDGLAETPPLTPPSVPEGPAISLPATRAVLRNRLRRAVTVLVAGLLLLVGFGVAVSAVDDSTRSLEHNGTKTSATIVAVRTGKAGTADVRYAANGTTMTGTLDLGAYASKYHAGQQVTVYFDPKRPARFTVAGADSQPQWSVWAMIVLLVGGAFLTAAGAASALSWWRVRRLLARLPWREVSVRSHLDGITRVLAQVTFPDGEQRIVRAVAGSKSGATACAEFFEDADATLLAAGPDGRRVVVARPGGAPIVRMRAPRSEQIAQRWSTQLTLMS